MVYTAIPKKSENDDAGCDKRHVAPECLLSVFNLQPVGEGRLIGVHGCVTVHVGAK